nr:PREDICTED: probable NADH kinase isoform X2 [Musa acuminata subsp. malaccensis]
MASSVRKMIHDECLCGLIYVMHARFSTTLKNVIELFKDGPFHGTLWWAYKSEDKKVIFFSCQLSFSRKRSNCLVLYCLFFRLETSMTCTTFSCAKSIIVSFFNDRLKVHKDTINLCQDVLRCKFVDWEPVICNNLCHPIHHVDLVITIGGDGTLLQASHFLDDSIPVLGVNSDPTQIKEVNESSNDFDAARSTGYLCAATAQNFEQVLDNILESYMQPSEISRLSITQWYLVSHLGSTAAILSGGGLRMPISSRDLQYMVREPISPGPAEAPLMHGFVKPDQSIFVEWYSQEGVVYIDGCHVTQSLKFGDKIKISAKAPVLKLYLPQDLVRDHNPKSYRWRSVL